MNTNDIKKKFTKKQKKWLKDYKEVTGYEIMYDYETFDEIARHNYTWFRNKCEYELNAIDNIPYDNE